MTGLATWLLAAVTVGGLLAYEGWLGLAGRRNPLGLARSAHATLREDWFAAVSAQKGSEILAVQTLRNSLMSSTMIASTALLGLMGMLTLAAPSLHASFGDSVAGWPPLTPRLVMELVVLALLLASLMSSVMAVRYYHHVGFIGGMPVDSEARRRWSAAGSAYVRKAGVLYSWSLRQLVLVVPAAAFVLHPVAGPVAAAAVIAALVNADRFQG